MVRELLRLEEADPDVVLGELVGLLAVQEHLCIWFLARAMEQLEGYIEDPRDRWEMLKGLVYEALDVAESGVYLYGAHLTSMSTIVKIRIGELARKRLEESLKKTKAQAETQSVVNR